MADNCTKFDRDHFLMQHKILTNDLIESKIEIY